MNTPFSDSRKLGLLLVLAAGIIAGTFLLLPAIPQDPAYHRFADRETHFGIPNFWNVATNLPFLWVGLAGIRELNRNAPAVVPEFRVGYLVFFIGIALTGLGSGYYHLAPDNDRLVWDRLPMAIAFMALVAVIVAEYLSAEAAQALLWPLLFLGAVSVFHWHLTETEGRGDLRLYGLVQFLSLLWVTSVLLLFRPRFTGVAYYWASLATYGAAKLAEWLDEPIFRGFPWSGHSLKHLLAGAGLYCILRAVRRRNPLRALRDRDRAA